MEHTRPLVVPNTICAIAHKFGRDTISIVCAYIANTSSHCHIRIERTGATNRVGSSAVYRARSTVGTGVAGFPIVTYTIPTVFRRRWAGSAVTAACIAGLTIVTGAIATISVRTGATITRTCATVLAIVAGGITTISTRTRTTIGRT